MVWLIEHEPLINVVIDSKRKMLTSLTKRYVVGSGVRSSPDADTTITGGEAGPNPCMVLMWNVVNRSCPLDARKAFRKKDRWHGRQRMREEAKANL
jgi:hypothetical protein